MSEKIVIDSDAIDAEISAGDRLQELVFQRAKVIALEAKVPHSEPDTYVVTLAHMEQAIAEHDTAALLARAESAEAELRAARSALANIKAGMVGSIAEGIADVGVELARFREELAEIRGPKVLAKV